MSASAELKNAPQELVSWLGQHSNLGEARQQCTRADWLFWLLSAAAPEDRLRRAVVRSGVAAVEMSPRLRGHAARVAAAHIWSAPAPQDKPRRSIAKPLLLSSAMAAVVVVIADVVLTPRIEAFQRTPSGPRWRAVLWFVVWNLLAVGLQQLITRKSDAKLRAEVATTTFESARTSVFDELARAPDDQVALRHLRDAESRLFRSTST